MPSRQAKRVTKILRFYDTNFHTGVPYKVMVDGTFCYCANRVKLNLEIHIPRYLKNEGVLHTTKCAIAECKQLGKPAL